ncbi:ribose/xylose/arabinose/galactoside ABC-type transport systems, permease components [Microbacterium testaceum StLB037]|uniref:Autoinducer 2 import system permease protein LsrD n=1 Tax=Microbacterium testaceum (strain StLB037) TaxID=979556 RepID=E8NDA1_MICTS|nr:ABC transporter permease [Microbacterium testaceum]BAJ74959.1 ribose/xylose/arabinose/galactoside ABC-type transport systems, permease components [Microbacterium testaceum StLB037]
MTSTAVDDRARTYRAHARPFWRRALLTREAAIIGILLLVIAVSLATVRNFDSPLTVTYLLRDIAPILLIALPMTLIIITEEIDLSVASIVGLSSVTVGVLTQSGWPFELAALAAIVVGLVAGAINGFLVTVVGLPSLAVTIGTLALFRGIAVGLLGTEAVTEFPETWTDLAKANIPGTPLPLIMIPFVVLAIVFAVLLHLTSFGRSLYAIGLNKEAAQFSGIDVARTKFLLFVMSGTVSGFAGVYFTLLYSNARGENAMGMELQVIAAVLLGGVSIFGGRGALHGVIAGVLLIGTLGSALRLAGVTSDIINVITGALLVLSVVSASLLAWLQARRVTALGKRKSVRPTAPASIA